MKTQTLIMVLAAVVFSTGCASMKSRFDKMPTMASSGQAESAEIQTEEQPEFAKPDKMLAIWKDSVRTEPGKPSMRGFGGRIFLYDKNGAPIRSQGDLVIYGFDDSVKEREGSKADQKIVFRNDKFQTRYSESALGPSYSVWVDWDKVGGPDKSVTLVPFFRTPEGKIVKAGQAIYTLHTPKGDGEVYKEKLVSHQEGSKGPGNSVAHADYLQSDGEKNMVVQASGVQKLPQSKGSVRTTTITVPKETQKRLRESSFDVEKERPMKETAVDAVAEKSSRSKLPSRLEEARKKRLEKIREANVFGMPGQL